MILKNLRSNIILQKKCLLNITILLFLLFMFGCKENKITPEINKEEPKTQNTNTEKMIKDFQSMPLKDRQKAAVEMCIKYMKDGKATDKFANWFCKDAMSDKKKEHEEVYSQYFLLRNTQMPLCENVVSYVIAEEVNINDFSFFKDKPQKWLKCAEQQVFNKDKEVRGMQQNMFNSVKSISTETNKKAPKTEIPSF